MKFYFCIVLCACLIGVFSKRLKGTSGWSFAWSNCGSVNDPIKISNLRVTPDPIPIPGTETITAVVQLSRNLSSPIEAAVSVKKKSFLGWIKIPCVDNIGSCHYEDLCAMSPYKKACPNIFKKLQLPCACPIQEGLYSVKNFQIPISNVGPHWLEHGKYKGRISLATVLSEPAKASHFQHYMEVDPDPTKVENDTI